MKKYDFSLGFKRGETYDRRYVDISESAEGEWVRSEDAICLENHIREAMKLMRDNGSNETEYCIYAVLAAALNRVDSDAE
jgi:hypothetical protein